MKIISQETLNLFRHAPRCEWCGRTSMGRLDPHHVWPSGAGGGNRLDISINLMAVHRHCHDIVQEEMQETCIALVASRERCLQSELVEAIFLLRRLPKRPTRSQVEVELRKLTFGAGRLVMGAIGHLLEDVA